MFASRSSPQSDLGKVPDTSRKIQKPPPTRSGRSSMMSLIKTGLSRVLLRSVDGVAHNSIGIRLDTLLDVLYVRVRVQVLEANVRATRGRNVYSLFPSMRAHGRFTLSPTVQESGMSAFFRSQTAAHTKNVHQACMQACSCHARCVQTTRMYSAISNSLKWHFLLKKHQRHRQHGCSVIPRTSRARPARPSWAGVSKPLS